MPPRSLFNANGSLNVALLDEGTISLRFSNDKTKIVVTWLPDDPEQDVKRTTLDNSGAGGTGVPDAYFTCVAQHSGSIGETLTAIVTCLGSA